VGTSFCRFVTLHAFDRQTDKQTDAQKGLHNTVRCITYSRTVKTASNVIVSESTVCITLYWLIKYYVSREYFYILFRMMFQRPQRSTSYRLGHDTDSARDNEPLICCRSILVLATERRRWMLLVEVLSGVKSTHRRVLDVDPARADGTSHRLPIHMHHNDYRRKNVQENMKKNF